MGRVAVASLLIIAMIGSLALHLSLKAQLDGYRIDQQGESDLSIQYSGVLESGHYYELQIEIVAHGPKYARAIGTVTVSFNGTEYETYQLDHWVSSSRALSVTAIASQTVAINVVGDTDITVNGSIERGEEWNVEVYQDLPANLISNIELTWITTMALVAISILVLPVIIGWDKINEALAARKADTETDKETMKSEAQDEDHSSFG